MQFKGTVSYTGGDLVTLQTELGEFAIPKTELPELAPGNYRGQFGLRRVHVAAYHQAVGLVVLLGAKLEGYAFDESEPESAEPSNVTEEVRITEADTDRALFGADRWPLGSEVTLDPEVEPKVFKQQRERLKALGYRFQAQGQCWVKAA
jgi:hypothetical protein